MGENNDDYLEMFNHQPKKRKAMKMLSPHSPTAKKGDTLMNNNSVMLLNTCKLTIEGKLSPRENVTPQSHI